MTKNSFSNAKSHYNRLCQKNYHIINKTNVAHTILCLPAEWSTGLQHKSTFNGSTGSHNYDQGVNGLTTHFLIRRVNVLKQQCNDNDQRLKGLTLQCNDDNQRVKGLTTHIYIQRVNCNGRTQLHGLWYMQACSDHDHGQRAHIAMQ